MGLESAEAEAADRALSSVARKLDTSMSVEYTVNDLIATATDPANLSQIFVGKCDLIVHRTYMLMIARLDRLESPYLNLLFDPMDSYLIFIALSLASLILRSQIFCTSASE